MVCEYSSASNVLNVLIEHQRNQFREQLKCVKIVWDLVKDKLSEYGECLLLVLLYICD